MPPPFEFAVQWCTLEEGQSLSTLTTYKSLTGAQ